MAVCEIDSVTVEPYEDGASFGDTGPYEVVRAVLRYTVDPTTDAGRRIVDLEHAARDAHGMVAFESDLIVLRPVDPASGNRGLLYTVANRGSATSLPLSIGVFAVPGVSDRIEPGDGFLLRAGTPSRGRDGSGTSSAVRAWSASRHPKRSVTTARRSRPGPVRVQPAAGDRHRAPRRSRARP